MEFHAPTHDAQWMLPGADPALFREHAPWMANVFWTPRTNRLVFTYKLWILKIHGDVVLVDTGCGNHKDRLSPYQNHINTPVLDWLEAFGAPAEKVTHVVHTHIHADHVGWNTRLIDGRWVPTFPNAVYHMPRLDYDLFRNHAATSMGPDMYDCVLEDSVLPVVKEKLVRFVEDGDEIAGLIARSAPGHTPGHMTYTFRCGGEELLFSGDVFHSPLQVVRPSLNSRWCEDADEARRTRHAVLCCAAGRNVSILAAHAKGVHGWRIGGGPDRFSVGFDEAPAFVCA